jgi:hypothetical protein
LPPPPAGVVTGVFLFHGGSLKNRWYACPSSHILFAVCAFFRLTFPPRLCSFRQPCAALQCAWIICVLPTTYPHRRPSTPFPPHLKPPYCTGISPYGGSSGPGNLTSETSRATSPNPSTYRWTSARCSFVVRPWFLAKCAAVCFGTTAVRHSTHAMIRCLREWRKYRAKTLASGGVGAGAAIARPICRIVRLWAVLASSVDRMPLRSGCGCSDYMSGLSTAYPYTYGHTSPHPNPSESYTIPPLPLPATAPRLRLSVSGGPCIWLRFRPTFDGRLGLCGVGARVGTSKPTSPLGRRRRYLAPVWVFDAKKYAHHLAAAPRPARPDPGRFGRVSFKQSWSNNHGRAPLALG